MKGRSTKIILLVFFVFLIYNGIKLLNPEVQTQIAVAGNMEKTYSLDGIVIRNENVIKGGENGVFEARVKEHEVVKKNKLVATVYKGEIDKETGAKLEEINRRINELSAQSATPAHGGDVQRIESTIDAKINDIIVASRSADVQKVAELKKNLNTLALKRFAVTTSDGDTSQILADLRNQKEVYEKSINASKTDLFSPSHGVFSTTIDGYENIVSYDKADDLTVSDYNLLKKNKATPNGKCKIIDNYEWAVATVVNDATASELQKGDSVYIRFKDESTDVPAKISYISEEESNKYVVVITSTENCYYAMTNRFVEFDLVYEKYEGIKIPAKSINVTKDGVTGVYVLENSVVKFKQADILYKDSKTAIVKINNSKDDYLLLYDDIITKAPADCAPGKKYD